MRALITGAAGFIGSHLADSILTDGNEVIGVDCFTDYYSTSFKRRNITYLRDRQGWQFLEKRAGALSPVDLAGVDVVYHLAAQPGVRASWRDFESYIDLNLVETERVANSVSAANVPTIVFASSSSVYGDLSHYPATEGDTTKPRSPYGVTKLAGEKLWDAYVFANPMRVAAMRFFTVYGPGQRPDMATQRLIRAAIDGTTFTLFGDGEQRRDFTFVTDVVQACKDIAACGKLSESQVNVFNVGGTGDVSMKQLVRLVESEVGRPIDINWVPAQQGDVRRTGADITAISEITGWSPSTSIEEGVHLHTSFELDPSLEKWRAKV